MAMWNPWRGCRKCSEGCRYCYIHKGDAKRGVDTSLIQKTKDFAKPVERFGLCTPAFPLIFSLRKQMPGVKNAGR